MCKELLHLRTQVCNFQEGCSLNSFSGLIEETTSRSYLGLIRKDTRSVDYGSSGAAQRGREPVLSDPVLEVLPLMIPRWKPLEGPTAGILHARGFLRGLFSQVHSVWGTDGRGSSYYIGPRFMFMSYEGD